MADDEPLDDARQVAVAAAAAAARVVETVAREAADYRSRQRATLERAQDQRRAQETLSRLGQRYDSPAQRQQRDADRAAAGVPAEARNVRATADLMNGTPPARAAASSQGTNPVPSSATTPKVKPRTPPQQRPGAKIKGR